MVYIRVRIIRYKSMLMMIIGGIIMIIGVIIMIIGVIIMIIGVIIMIILVVEIVLMAMIIARRNISYLRCALSVVSNLYISVVCSW